MKRNRDEGVEGERGELKELIRASAAITTNGSESQCSKNNSYLKAIKVAEKGRNMFHLFVLSLVRI